MWYSHVIMTNQIERYVNPEPNQNFTIHEDDDIEWDYFASFRVPGETLNGFDVDVFQDADLRDDCNHLRMKYVWWSVDRNSYRSFTTNPDFPAEPQVLKDLDRLFNMQPMYYIQFTSGIDASGYRTMSANLAHVMINHMTGDMLMYGHLYNINQMVVHGMWYERTPERLAYCNTFLDKLHAVGQGRYPARDFIEALMDPFEPYTKRD
jgi:hypothetical protein